MGGGGKGSIVAFRSFATPHVVAPHESPLQKPPAIEKRIFASMNDEERAVYKATQEVRQLRLRTLRSHPVFRFHTL
jgi:hypothetical protein